MAVDDVDVKELELDFKAVDVEAGMEWQEDDNFEEEEEEEEVEWVLVLADDEEDDVAAWAGNDSSDAAAASRLNSINLLYSDPICFKVPSQKSSYFSGETKVRYESWARS